MNGGFVVINGETNAYIIAIGRGLRDDPTSDACPHTALEFLRLRQKRDFPGKEVDFSAWVCSECWAIRDFPPLLEGITL